MMQRWMIFVSFLLVFFGLIILVVRVYSLHFKISTIAMKGTMLATLLVPLFFVLSMISGRGAYGASPVVYTIINSITGIAYYLFVGGLIFSLIILVGKITHTSIPQYIGIAFLCLSLLAGIGGLIQAHFIKITKYTISLPNTPSELQGKTAVFVTDTHFGLVNHEKFSNKVVDRITSLNPTFVIHAGDFYDGPKINTHPITSSWKRLADKIPVFYAPGNHEEYGDYNLFLASIKNAGITVLDNKVTTFNGLQIAGITYHEGKNPIEATKNIQALAITKDRPSILINHPPTSLAAAEEQGFSLMTSGHTHNGQFWPNTYLVRKIYGAYSYGLNKYKNISVLTSSGVGTFGPPLRLFNTPEIVHITFQ